MARFEIEVSTSGEAKIKQLQSEVDKLDKAQTTAKQSGDGLASTLKSIGLAAGSYIAIDKLASAFIGLASSVVTTAGEFEKFSTILATMYGSSEKAKESMKWLKEFSEKTPYTLKQTTDAFVKLKSYGIDGTDGSLKTLGDTAAAMGKDLIQSVEAMADAMVGENERLKEFGIRASTMGKTVGYEWTDASGKTKHIIIENNKEIIKSTLEAIFNSKYGGAMEDLSKTWVGIVSNLSDKWDSFKLSLVDDGAFTSLKNSLGGVVTELDNLLKNKDAMDGFRNAFAGTLGAVVTTIGFFGKAIIQAQGWSSVFSTAWTISVNKIQEVINDMVILVSESFLSMYELINKASGGRFYTKGIESTKSYIKELQNSNKAFIAESNKVLSQHEQTIKQGNAAQKAIDDITEAIKKQTVAKKENVKTTKNGGGVVGSLDGGLSGSTEDKKASRTKDAEIKDKLNQLKNYYEAIYDYENAWNKQQEIMRIDNKSLTESQFTSLAEFAKREYFDKLNKMQSDAKAHAEKEYNKRLDSYKSIMGQFGTPYEVIINKYLKIIEDLKKTRMVTNEDYKKINEAYIADLHKELANQLSQMSKIGSILGDVLTTVFNNVYDGIKESYQPLIKSNQYMARSLELQSNMYKTFGLSGSGAVSNYKSQIAQIEAQRQILAQDYKIMEQSKKYKEIVQPILEAGGLAFAAAGAVSLAPAQSILAGIEFALNAYKTADSMTGFTKYQQEYISAVETFKQQMRDLADTLVDIAGSVYDAIPSFRDLYDTISGTNTYQIQSQIEALKYVKQYTSLDKQSLTSFITDVLTAQSKFVNESINIAGSANENLIQSIDIFSKYGLAVDSLNEKFSDSLGVVADLIKANDEANNSILDFAKSIKGELSGLADKKTYRMESTRDFYSALRDYRSGNIEASQLLEYATTVKGTLSSSSEFKALIKELENVAKPQSTEDLLTKLTNQIANIQAVGLPVVNISSAQSVEAQTLTEIKDTKSLIQKMLDMLSNPVDGIVNFLEQILKAIAGVAVAIAEGVVKIVSSIAKAVVDLVRDLGKAFLDAVKGLATGVFDGAGDLVSKVTSPVVNVFKKLFADGGYTGYNNGQIDSTGERVAGIVHEGEWVAPRWMVESNASLFNALESARLNGSNPSLGGVLVGVDNSEVVQAINLNTQYSQQMNIRLTSLEAMFRTVTNGANAMMIEII